MLKSSISKELFSFNPSAIIFIKSALISHCSFIFSFLQVKYAMSTLLTIYYFLIFLLLSYPLRYSIYHLLFGFVFQKIRSLSLVGKLFTKNISLRNLYGSFDIVLWLIEFINSICSISTFLLKISVIANICSSFGDFIPILISSYDKNTNFTIIYYKTCTIH